MFTQDNNMNGNWYALRWRVLQRDNFTCQYCGQSAPSVMLHVDHIVPRAAGGTDDMDNLLSACAACNIGRNLDHFTVPKRASGTKRKVSLFDEVVDYMQVNGAATATELGKVLKRQKSRANIASMLANNDNFAVSHKDGKSVYYMLTRNNEGE